MSEELERLAKALTDLREAEGMSQADLARRTALSRATIRHFENGRGRMLPLPGVARQFEEVLGWEPGSIPTKSEEAADHEPPTDSGVPAE